MIDYFKNRITTIKNMMSIIFIFTAIFISIFFVIINLNISDSNLKLNPKFLTMDKGWKISIDDNVIEESATLPFWVDAEAYQSIKIETALTSDNHEFNAIVSRNYHQTLIGYINDERVYIFPSGTQAKSSFITTDDWNQIPLRNQVQGDMIALEFDTGKVGYHGYIDPPYVGEDNAILGYLKKYYAVPYVLSILLITIGIFMLIVASVYTRKVAERDQILMGLVFISAGIWFADRSKMPIFMVGSNVKFFLAFICVLLISVLLFFYISYRFKRQNQKLITTIIYVDVVLFLGAFILLGAEIYPVHYIIRFAYITIFLACLYFINILWVNTYGKNKKYNNRVEQNALRIEFVASIATIILSGLSIVIDAITTNNWSLTQRDWSGVGNLQLVAINIFALAQLIIMIYKGYHGSLEREVINKKLHESKLELMMGQIQPHFMFNTLSSIRTLIKVDPDLAYSMLYNFSNYLRANVDNITNLEGIPFASEVEHIQSYVAIEEVRFGDRLDMNYDIKETNFIVPPLSIQPLVENAIKHGVCKKPEGGSVWLKSYSDEENYIVEVRDTGVGFDPTRMNTIFNYHEMGLYEDESDTEETLDVLKQIIDLSTIRDSAGQLVHLEEHVPEMDLSGHGSEIHRSTGMKNIIIRLKEISNATIEIESQKDVGTVIKVYIPKDINTMI